MSYRFWIAVGVSGVVLPGLVPVVQSTTEVVIQDSNLGWLNPGNGLGILLSYVVGGLSVSAIASAARRIQRFDAKEILWWFGAATIISSMFVGVRAVVGFYWSKELGLLLASATAGIGIIQITRLKFPEYNFDTHVSGQRIRSAWEIIQERGKHVLGLLPWGADIIDFGDENEHFLLWGNIGGGKTQMMKMMMASVALRENDLWIVFDPKPEFVGYLEGLGRDVVILNPLDQRRTAWSMAQDIDDETIARTFVEMLIPTMQGSENYWAEAAQNILEAILAFLIRSGKSWDLRDMLLIAFSQEDLKCAVGSDRLNEIIAEGLEGKNERSGTNDYMLTLNNYLKKYRVIAALMHNAEKKISLRELLESGQYGRKTLVLGSDEKSRSTVKTFNALMFETIINIALDLPEQRERRLWVWIDEISEASRFLGKNLVRFMTKVRSKGGCAVLAAQNRAGLVSSFDEDYTQQLIELSKRMAVVGGVDGKSAQELAESYFGQVQVVKTQFGQSKEYDGSERELGEGGSKVSEQRVSPSYQVGTEYLVSKESLYSSSMPKTGPEHGLTGFFWGGRGGPHWHTYTWDEVKGMQVEDAEGVKAYERIQKGDPDLVLVPFSVAEREKWKLPPEAKNETVESLSDDDNPLFERFGEEEQIHRTTVLKMLDFEQEDLDELTAGCGLGVGIESFSRSQMTAMMAQIGMQMMGVDIDWEDKS